MDKFKLQYVKKQYPWHIFRGSLVWSVGLCDERFAKLTEVFLLYAFCIRCLGSTSSSRWNLFPMVLTRAHHALVKRTLFQFWEPRPPEAFHSFALPSKNLPIHHVKNPRLFCWIMKDLWPNGSHFSSWQLSRPHSIAAFLTGCGVDAWTNSSEDERTV